MDVEAYLVNEVKEKLLSNDYTSAQEIAAVAVETVLESLESQTSEHLNENIINYGVTVWMTLSDHKLVTIKDLKDFVSQAEALGLTDDQPVQGNLSIAYNADVDKLLEEE